VSSEVEAELVGVVELLRRDYGLDPHRGGMLRTLGRHLESRLAALHLHIDAFLVHLDEDPRERDRLLHAMTVNHSWFFRDPKQLEALGERMRELHRAEPSRPLELWVAGCATGQEAWTLAMIAAQLNIPARVLGTDIDAAALTSAKRGDYGPWSLRELPEPLWAELELSGKERWRVSDRLRSTVEFEVHNLCEPCPPRRFDVISCRNVLIYFEPERAHEVVARLRAQLRAGGELVLGAGDLMFQPRISEREEQGASAARGPSAPSSRSRSTPARPPRPRRPPPPLPASSASSANSTNSTSSKTGTSATPRVRVERALAEPRGVHNDPLGRELERAGREISAGRYDQGLIVLEVLINEDPLIAEAHLWVGIAHHSLGEDRLAGESLRRARCLEPELWPGTLFAALSNERRGRWQSATRCWAELERLITTPNAPDIEGTPALVESLPMWRAEALALARQRNSKPDRAKLSTAPTKP